MKYSPFVFALAIMAQALPATAFELKNSERQERLKIELEPAPSQVQENFDKYVQELAAAARRDAISPPEKPDRIKELQAKALNPILRW
jgi:hypothetical protein